jgi:hypothetical protein
MIPMRPFIFIVSFKMKYANINVKKADEYVSAATKELSFFFKIYKYNKFAKNAVAIEVIEINMTSLAFNFGI